MKKRLKINGIIIFLAVILLISFSSLFFRSARETPWNLLAKIFGASFILFGQILRACARGYKSENSQEGHSLIQGGPYTLVRNPMYLGIFFIGLGIVIALFKWWVIIIFFSVFIWRYIFLIFKEEEKLLTMFPREYPDYQQRVPRLFPSFKAILRKDITGYLPLKALWLKREIGSITALLLLLIFMEARVDMKSARPGLFLKDAALFFSTVILFMLLAFYLIRRTNIQQ
ncbi:MAG: isoprenylcysteine carboxylmethyltransferase family protein [Candidatus Omnitrophica bacterium]|nr:isoprenylcysteine carboxylmethyltransferase family protein [Candidatus Omnitrophota bacterium]